MATSSRVRRGVTLEEFLRMPGIDENPGKEYVDGRIEAKVAAQQKHSIIQTRLASAFDRFAEPRGLGMAFIELRCTFSGRSILPDVSFLRSEQVTIDARGEIADNPTIPPDIHVEIISPDKRVQRSREKLIHSTGHGCSLGILIHPYRHVIEIHRPGRPAETLTPDGVIDAAPVLPGFLLPVSEVFGWLVLRVLRPGADPA